MTSMLLTDRYDFATSSAAVVAVLVAAAMEGIVVTCGQKPSSPSPLGTGERVGVRGLPQHYPHPKPLPQAGEGTKVNYAQASLLQSRGVMFFSLAYAAADCSIIGRTSSRSGWIQSVITFHWLPSHCWNLTAPPPSWSRQLTFNACMKFAAPSSLRRASLICRFSMPHRTCSPVSGFLPYFSCALRIPSTVTMPKTTPRL